MKLDKNASSESYAANFENSLSAYSGDPQARLYSNLLWMKNGCIMCKKLKEQKVEITNDARFTYRDRALLGSQDAETGSIVYNSPDLRKGVREFREHCANEDCDEGCKLAIKIFEDNADKIITLEKEKTEKAKEKTMEHR